MPILVGSVALIILVYIYMISTSAMLDGKDVYLKISKDQWLTQIARHNDFSVTKRGITSVSSIDDFLRSMGSDLDEYVSSGQLPAIPDDFEGDTQLDDNPHVAEQLEFAANHQSALQDIVGGLANATVQHKEFFDRVLHAIECMTCTRGWTK
ncbi:Aste57867_15916 [Aphanomyces stellatus]|uniref:Aste57867_15916 protein n=1 Tax=Aphanomyces stellatus TaxID=120398 RepID=A0A485L473_9STRA|nr:hypothetical protein As57867_015860 [Aphanomyces stellatus]VFT92702.1 Aste57867_15916 [Aphanomyces stellatus]